MLEKSLDLLPFELDLEEYGTIIQVLVDLVDQDREIFDKLKKKFIHVFKEACFRLPGGEEKLKKYVL